MDRTPVDYQGAVNMVDRVSDIPTKTSSMALLVFAFGLNDLGQTAAAYTTANYITDYTTILNDAVSKGWSGKNILIIPPFYIGSAGYTAYAVITGNAAPDATRHLSFIDASRTVANTFGTMFFDIYDNQLNNNTTLISGSDNIHPTDAGYEYIANDLLKYLEAPQFLGFINSTGLAINDYSGTNRGGKMYSISTADNLFNFAYYPVSGTNVGSSFSVIPKGTGYVSTLKTQIGVFNTDFIADGTNYEGLLIRAGGAQYEINSAKGGSGTARNIDFQINSTSIGTLSSTGFTLNSANIMTAPTFVVNNSAGTNRTGKIYSISGADNIASIAFYPNSGTNVSSLLSLIPKGTGGFSTNRAQLGIFNKDFVADATNYEYLSIRAADTKYIFESLKGGTGTARPIEFGIDAVNVFNLSSTGAYFGSGSTASTAKITLGAGTTTAGTSPLKFTSGTLLTTAEAGAVEFLTDKFYGTITTGAARKELTLNDAALTSGRIPYVTTNGRIVDEAGFEYDASANVLSVPSVTSTVAQFGNTNTVAVSGATTRKTYEILWVDVTSNAGNTDVAVFTGYTDATAQIEFTVTAVKTSDGVEAYSSKKIASFHKDGSADATLIGSVTTVHEVENAATNVPALTISMNGANVRAAYDLGGGVDTYRWTIWARVTITQL